MKLTKEQIIFCKHHKIPLWYILDATNMTSKEYSKLLKSTDNLVAINSLSKNCNKGHKLNIRDSHGRCVECRVSNFSFIKPQKEGYVYVVGSLEGKILKVGYSLDLEDRFYKLNHDGYGGYNDWEIIFSGKYKAALNIENQLHSLLKDFGFNKSYSHYGKIVNCYELFKCNYEIIQDKINFINNGIDRDQLSDIFELNDAVKKYCFSDNKLTTDEPLNSTHLQTNYDEDYDSYLRKYGILGGRFKNNITY